MYLKEHGVEAYDTLFSAEGVWTDPTVAATIDRMLSLLTDENIDGGVDGALATPFVEAVAQVFGTSPSAELYFGGSFVGGIATGEDVNPELAGQEGTAIDWFPFPTIDGNGEGLVTFGGDQIAAMVADTDTAEFLEYMLSQEAGEVWASAGTVYRAEHQCRSEHVPDGDHAEGCRADQRGRGHPVRRGRPPAGRQPWRAAPVRAARRGRRGTSRGSSRPKSARRGRRSRSTAEGEGTVPSPSVPHRRKRRPSMAVISPPAEAAPSSSSAPGAGFSWAALLFLGPAALFLIVFLVYPTIYTFFLSFNRGRAGEFSEWVGLDNWITLFTEDPNFLRLGFPPSGALWNNVLWIIFYVSLTVLFGLLVAVMATRVRYESAIKAIVFLPQAIAATSLGHHLGLRLLARSRDRSPERPPRHRRRGASFRSG